MSESPDSKETASERDGDEAKEEKWKYLNNPDSKEFCTKTLPPVQKRFSFVNGVPFAYIYRREPLFYPSYIDRCLTVDRASILQRWGGGKFILKAKQGRKGLTTRTVVLDDEPVLSEIEFEARECVHSYLDQIAGTKRYCEHVSRLERLVSTSPDWLRALLRRLHFRLRPERPRPDGKPYWFPMLDAETDR